MNTAHRDGSPYNYSFPANLDDARKIVSLLLGVIEAPSSVVDLGGGTGAWCRAFRENGIERVVCIDHPGIADDLLLVDKDEFMGCDLSRSVPEPVRADLAVCLEVAEHLDESRTSDILHFLTESSDLILFSAAIPGQPDHRHINARPHSYWKKLFAERGYRRFDVVRPRIIGDETISYWYRQNLYLFANENGMKRIRTTVSSYVSIHDDFELVHKKVLSTYRAEHSLPKVRAAARDLLRSLRRSAAARLGFMKEPSKQS